MIPHEYIEELTRRTDIVDVVGNYVQLKRKGRLYGGLCPFHSEKTPSFYVYPDTQSFYCFGCGVGGDVIHFVRRINSIDYTEAVKMLAARAGMPEPQEDDKTGRLRSRILSMNKEAARYFHACLNSTVEEARQARAYWRRRGLDDKTIVRFGLGYAPNDGQALYQYLRDKGYNQQELDASGLFKRSQSGRIYCLFWKRVMTPIFDLRGNIIAFGGRVMDDSKPKYVNSPETLVYHKSETVFAMQIAKRSASRRFVLCEGYMDVISMHQAGFTNAVASLGTALTSGHASLVKRYTQEVLLLYDSDEAGVKAALRAIPILREAGVNSRVVNLRPHKDPDEFIKAEGAEAFEKRLEEATDSFMFRVSIASGDFPMDEPQGQNRFFERCAQYLLELSDELERNLYIEAIVKEYRRYGISVEDLRKRVNTLALKGTPAEKRIQPKSGGSPMRKKESAADKSQKLMLTWLVTYPAIFDTVEKYLSPSDFVVSLYKEVAEMLWKQHEEGDVNPARLLNAFTDSEEQKEVASLFNATIHLETKEEQQRAFSDALIRIKQESLAEKNKNWDPADMGALQELVKAKKDLEELGRKRQQLHISFE